MEKIMQNSPSLKPPFYGSRCIEKISFEMIVPYLDHDLLYKQQWGFKQADKKTTQILKRLIDINRQKHIFKLQALYGYYVCQAEDNKIIVYSDSQGKKQFCDFVLPRLKNGFCLADCFRAKNTGEPDVVALQLVTTGQKVADYEQSLFINDKYQEYLYWHGLNAATANGFAEFIHKRILAELGFIDNKQGERFALGYPPCPDLADQEKILTLLDAKRIGVTLSKSHQLIPESSTSAIITFHAQARHH
jgi:5-methyltetrahydrofolate--homocysteine methyltransferase